MVPFDEFWSIYPRKVNKKAARDAWARLKVSPPLFNQITTNIELRLKSGEWQTTKMQYIPHASTYLNGERWDDEVYAPLEVVESSQEIGFVEKHTNQDWRKLVD